MSGATPVLLDASAVLAYVLEQDGSETVEKVLPLGSITSVNLTEVLYKARERGYRNDLPGLQLRLVRTGLTVVDVTEADAGQAAELIANSRSKAKPGDDSLSLGDGICIAVAIRLKALLVGDDRYWETLDLPVEYQPFR